MRAIVTGGAGFIGSHLCDALLRGGHSVIALDNFSTGNRRNVAHLREHPGFQLLEHDVSKPLPASVPGAELLFHLASPASPADFSRIPLQIIEVNAFGTYHLLEWAAAHGARMLYTSTSEAYGDPLEHPQREDYWGNVNPVGPRACYDESKRLGETLVMTFVGNRGVDGRLVRIFNTYGPRMNPRDGRVVPNFVSQALAGRPLTIYGDGRQTRSFCYVQDMVNGLMAVMLAPAEVARGRVYNVGTPDERTILDFALIIRELVGSGAPIEHLPAMAEDPARRCPDISRISSEIGWEPRISLDQGLRLTIDWFRSVAEPSASPAAAGQAAPRASG